MPLDLEDLCTAITVKVAGSTTTVYIFSSAKVIAEYANGAAPSSPTREYIYAGGPLLLGIDAIGLIPGTRVARMIGHQAGYVGKVADQVGSNVARATGASTSAANGLASLRDTSPLGLLSSVLTIGGFAPPPFSTAAAVGSIGVDVAKIWKASKNCN